MDTTSVDRARAEARRRAFRRFMQERMLKAKPWAEKAGVSANAIYNFLNARSDSLSQPVMEKLARVVHVQPSQLTDEKEFARLKKTVTIHVLGAVEAGAYREAMEWTGEERYEINVLAPASDRRNLFGLEVRGESMNELYPPGSVVICSSIFEYDHELLNGDRVIVQRRNKNGHVEATVKEIAAKDGRAWLVPRSTSPEFRAAIEIPWPHYPTDDQPARADEEEIWIVGVVVGSYRIEKHV